MGFAGQVFAARVAIGLAVPSRKALQQTGGILATGVKQIHQRIKQQAMASNLDSVHREKLRKLNTMTTTSAARTANLLRVRLEQNLKQLNQQTNNSIRKSFKNVEQNYARLRAKLSKPLRQQLFAGTAGLTGMKAAQQMARNMAAMSKKDRADAIAGQRRIVNLMQEELNRKRRLLENSKQTTKKQKEAYRELVKTVKAEDKALTKEKQRLKVLKEIEGEVSEITHEMKEQDAVSTEMGETISGAATTLKDNFMDALRNSVALLAAFGYKLQQSTSDLVEFERELLNANSVFNLTNDSLFNVGNEIIKFGNEFGIATQNGATGLYQLASAGLEANEAMQVLPETLKLSMAVQGDHNTISKLTAQTLFGFGMEMSQAAEVTDKFAFAIQKSLIEYQDLSSAVKFALPFFTSTGQSIDQLLGALQILTNRALEAGIAGRGLRQALAEFAESAMDAEVGFRKMGVEILNAEGEMKQLTEIAAQFAEAVGPETASNTELLTTLIQDLNVRGATAFIHLVQASDEFTEAVQNTANAGGQLDEMVRIQNQALSAQIQILKTNIFSIFALRDASYEGTEFINAFHEAVVNMVQGLKDMIVVEEDGIQKLTEFGQSIQDAAIVFIENFDEVIHNLLDTLQSLAEEGKMITNVFELLYLPLKLITDVMKILPAGWLEMIVYFKMFNSVIPLTTLAWWSLSRGIAAATASQIAYNAASGMGGLGMGMGRLSSKGITKGKTGRWMVPGRGGKGFATKGAAMRAMGARAAPTAARALPWIARGALGMTGVGLLALGASVAIPWYMKKRAEEGKAGGGYLTPMAQGGFPSGGAPYLVGEQGPELFVPEAAGQLLNNGATQNNMGSGMKLNNVTIGIDSFGGLV
jgi:TP901 family phage tail tape measure protein